MQEGGDAKVYYRSGKRWLVEIENWDWNLGLGIAGADLDKEAKFHGELLYTCGIDIHARLVAPRPHRDKPVRVWLSPTSLREWDGAEASRFIGRFYAHQRPLNGSDFSASIMIPDDSLSNVLTCLSSIWRYIHVWTDGPEEDAEIVQASFSRDVHENLGPWIKGEGHADF